MKGSFVSETDVPAYQREAVEWLKGYQGTAQLQDLLMRFRFSEEEVKLYRGKWSEWLKPKALTQKKINRGLH
jgi:hypothetical protein